MKKFIAFLVMICGMSAFTACQLPGGDEGHTHEASDQLSSDATGHWYECSGCDELLEKENHTYGEWVTIKQATTTEDGSKERVCSVCGYKDVQVIAKFDENHVHVPGAAATCTTDQVCEECGAVLVEKSGHVEVIDEAIAPTCTLAGKSEGKHCSICNEVTVAQAEVAALGHTEVVDAGYAATCTKKGLSDGKHCSVCKEVLAPQEEIPALGHAWDEGVTSGNTTTYTCGTCGETKAEVISVFDTASGSINEISTGVLSSANNTIAVYRGGEFSEGSISVDITLGTTAGDNGIIFGLKNTTGSTKFWEGAGVTYYFFFISAAGTAYLGKTTNGQWTVCGNDTTSSFALNKTYTLTVSRDKSNAGYDVINCYVDDVLYVSYKDSIATDGTGYGLRAGLSGIKYANLEVSEEVIGGTSSLDGYHVANGIFEAKDGKLVSKTSNAIAEVADGEFIYGSLEVTMKANGVADNGIIFSLTPNATHTYWEADVSYYFFFVNIHGLAFLGKVDNGTWATCQEAAITGYSPTGTYNIRIEKDATTIYGYVNDVCYITYADSFPLEGTGYGLRAGGNGVEYSNLKCQSSGEVVETYPNDLEVVSGKFVGTDGAARAAGTNNIGLIKGKSMTEGTLTANIKGVTTAKAGLVFGYSNENGVESYYRLVSRKSAQKVEVEKVVNGTVTTLFSNYLSAGYGVGREYPYRVVINNGEAYCYFWNTLYYVVDMELKGTGVGIYSEGASSQFRAYAASDDAEYTTTDTLLFGHSYFELWSNYKNDLKTLASSYNFGDYLNIGIGGSVAAHWYTFRESLTRYNASKAIYMIGINDLTGGTSPEMVVSYIKDTLLYMKEAKPELTVVLLSVNHCPARSTIREAISATNVLMQNLVSQYEWMSYAEVEYAFCDDGVNPDAYWFTDGLHPTANGYVQKIVPAIKNALDGVNQPELSPELQAKLLAEAKELKMGQLIDYSEWSYRSAEWQVAKPIYDQAVAAIEACTTVEAVENLDLTAYIGNLAAITRNTDYAYQELLTFKHGTWWETAQFSNTLNASSNGVYDIYHDGHRLNNNVQYTDMSFTFELSDITAEFPTVGIFFHANQNIYQGVSGYYINIVTDANYIQVWHFQDCYGASNNGPLTYIGGWVFPAEVENTEFRAIIEGNMIYVYTEADYQSKGKNAYGCSVDLTYGGQFKPYTYGSYGILNWSGSTGATGKLTIGNLSGKVATTTDKTAEVVNGIATGTSNASLNANLITYKENNTFSVSGYSYNLFPGSTAGNFDMEITPNATSDVAIAGVLFRASKDQNYDGLDGYLINFVSAPGQQFVQIWYLDNAYSTGNAASRCEYINGWVFPGQILGSTIRFKVMGDWIFMECGSVYLNIAVCLGNATTPVYYNGAFGVLSWADNLADLTINNVKVYA